MSYEQKHHEELVNGFYSQLKQIFVSSEQAIYLYMDDSHKVCNKKLATLLGYASPEEWAKVDNMLEMNVDKSSQQTVVAAYQNTMDKLVGSKIEVKMKTNLGYVVNVSIIMVPMAYQGHLFALHFISEKK
jgi:carbohydrate-binding DOMON domain-containing protein